VSKNNTDLLKLFEGLNPSQMKELRARIVPELGRIRNEIVNGERTSDMNGNDNGNNTEPTAAELGELRKTAKTLRASGDLTLEEMRDATKAIEYLTEEQKKKANWDEYFEAIAREEKLERAQYGDRYYETVIAPAKYPHRYGPKPIETSALENEYNELAVRMEELSRDASRDGAMEEMDAIATRMTKLEEQERAAQEQNHKIYLNGFKTELDALDADIQNITARLSDPSGLPMDRIEQLSQQLEIRQARRKEIENGDAFNLQWRPPEEK
jgi:hypothetical protein